MLRIELTLLNRVLILLQKSQIAPNYRTQGFEVLGNHTFIIFCESEVTQGNATLTLFRMVNLVNNYKSSCPSRNF